LHLVRGAEEPEQNLRYTEKDWFSMLGQENKRPVLTEGEYSSNLPSIYVPCKNAT